MNAPAVAESQLVVPDRLAHLAIELSEQHAQLARAQRRFREAAVDVQAQHRRTRALLEDFAQTFAEAQATKRPR